MEKITINFSDYGNNYQLDRIFNILCVEKIMHNQSVSTMYKLLNEANSNIIEIDIECLKKSLIAIIEECLHDTTKRIKENRKSNITDFLKSHNNAIINDNKLTIDIYTKILKDIENGVFTMKKNQSVESVEAETTEKTTVQEQGTEQKKTTDNQSVMEVIMTEQEKNKNLLSMNSEQLQEKFNSIFSTLKTEILDVQKCKCYLSIFCTITTSKNSYDIVFFVSSFECKNRHLKLNKNSLDDFFIYQSDLEGTEQDTIYIDTIFNTEFDNLIMIEQGTNMKQGTEQTTGQEFNVYSICKKIMDNQSITVFGTDNRQNEFNLKTEREQGKISIIAKKYDTHEFKIVELQRKFDIEKQLTDREQYFYNVVMMLMNSTDNNGHIFSLSSIAKFMFNNQILSKKQQEKRTELLLQGKTVSNEFFYINKKSVADLNLVNKIVGIIALRGIYSYEPLQDKNGCFLFKRVEKNTYYSVKKQEQKQEQKSDIEKMLSMVASDEFGISVDSEQLFSLIKQLATVYNEQGTEQKISIAILNK